MVPLVLFVPFGRSCPVLFLESAMPVRSAAVLAGNRVVRCAVVAARLQVAAAVAAHRAGLPSIRSVESSLALHRRSYVAARTLGVSPARLAVLVRACKTLALYR